MDRRSTPVESIDTGTLAILFFSAAQHGWQILLPSSLARDKWDQALRIGQFLRGETRTRLKLLPIRRSL
jgi:hypothetical protein